MSSSATFGEKIGDILEAIVDEHGRSSLVARRFALAINAPELDEDVVAFVLNVDVAVVKRLGKMAGVYVERWNVAHAAARKATGEE